MSNSVPAEPPIPTAPYGTVDTNSPIQFVNNAWIIITTKFINQNVSPWLSLTFSQGFRYLEFYLDKITLALM